VTKIQIKPPFLEEYQGVMESMWTWLTVNSPL